MFPRPSHRPVFDRLQAIKNWTVGRPGNKDNKAYHLAWDGKFFSDIWLNSYCKNIIIATLIMSMCAMLGNFVATTLLCWHLFHGCYHHHILIKGRWRKWHSYTRAYMQACAHVKSTGAWVKIILKVKVKEHVRSLSCGCEVSIQVRLKEL